MITIKFNAQELSDLILPLKGKTGNISALIHFSLVNIDTYNICHTDDIKFFVGKVGVEIGGATAPSFTFNLHDLQQLLLLNTDESLSFVYKDNCFYCYQGDNLIFMGDYDIPQARFFPPSDVWQTLRESKKVEIDRESFLSGILHLKRASDSSFIFLSNDCLAIQETDIQVYRKLEMGCGVNVCFHSDEVGILKNFQTSGDLYLKHTNNYLLFMDSKRTRLVFVPNRKEFFKNFHIPETEEISHRYNLDENEVLRLIRILSSFSEDSGNIQIVGDPKCLRATVKNEKFSRDSVLTLSTEVLEYGGERILFFSLMSSVLRVMNAYADVNSVEFAFYPDGVRFTSDNGTAYILNRNRGLWV